MKKLFKPFYLSAISCVLIAFSTSAFACKMSPLAGSTTVIKAMMDQINQNPDLQNSNITAIRSGKAFSGIYVVETRNDSSCQATGYQTTIQPDCSVKVETLSKPYTCKRKILGGK